MSATAPTMPKTCVGKLARIKVQGIEVVGSVIDFTPKCPTYPKRIRIQHGYPPLAGHTVFPHEYTFIGFCDQEED